jgi:hypothetical protein
MRNVHKMLVGKSEGNRSLRRPRRRWEDNIRMDLMEQIAEMWTGFTWLRIGTSGRFL